MDPVIDYTVRLALALLFLAALVHKLRGARAFQQTVAAYRIVPAVLVPGAAVAVVAVEVLVLVLLGDGDRNRMGLTTAGCLLLAYAAAIAVNLLRGRDRIDCGCVGSAGREGLSWWLVGRNLGLATIAFAGLAPVAERPLTIVDWVTAIAATMTLAGLYVAFDGLVANVPAYRRLREAT
jgi:hypothetical protein